MYQGVSNWLAAMPLDMGMVGTFVAMALTLAVLSYLLGKNPLFDLAQRLFVGVAAGYGAGLAWTHVLWPRAKLLIASPQTYWYYGVFFLLGVLLLARGVRPVSSLAEIPLGIMIGTGAGLALGGALTGSLVAQMKATVTSMNPQHHGGGALGLGQAVNAGLLVFSTLAVLCAFQYTVRREGPLVSLGNRIIGGLGAIGRKLIMVGFGVLLSGAALAFFAVLQSRIAFLVTAFLRLFGLDGAGF